MEKKLTRRQTEILNLFLDLYRVTGSPIHYVDLAENLGLGNTTVYEMLSLLEKKGYLSVEYQRQTDDQGPGRSTVLFYPTEKAIQLMECTGGDDDLSWETAKKRIHGIIEELGKGSHEELLQTLLDKIPERRSPLVYITEMITATVLSIATIREKAEEKGFFDRLSKIGLPGEIGISTLAGIGAALKLVQDVNLQFSDFLFEQSGKFHAMLQHLNLEKRKQLSEFTRQIIGMLKE